MPATEPFRTKFHYSNYMYTLAGHVAEVLTNESWEHLVMHRLIKPLGMQNSGLVDQLDNLDDIAKPYTLKNGKLIALDTDLAR